MNEHKSVERCATKVISCMWELSHPSRIAKLKHPTVVYRRNRGDVILTSKLGTLAALFPTVGPNLRTRGHQLKLVKQLTLSRVCSQ